VSESTRPTAVPQSDPSTGAVSDGALAEPSPRRGWQRWFGWQFWTLAIALAFGGLGYTAANMLLNLPAVSTSCSAVYWPLASASRRIYCAEIRAETRTREGLLDAIALIDGLPEDHPMRGEGQKLIDQWASELLELGEAKYQAGDIDGAIELARAIPEDLEAATAARERMGEWREVWSEGEAVEEQVRERIVELEWTRAFDAVVALTQLDNDYWSNQRYSTLVKDIQRARVEMRQVERAREALERGTPDDLREALELAREVEPGGIAFEAAESLVVEIGETMLADARAALDNGEWDTARQLALMVPGELEARDDVTDLVALARAGSQARLGSVDGLETAIARAKRLPEDSPLHVKAERLIERWTLEIADVRKLERARTIARPASVKDLQEAIDVADGIPSGNPRYREARREIGGWTRDIQTIQDRPVLNRAEQLARGNSVAAWREAIAVARRIGRGRALHDDAQSRIRQWTANIQRVEDRPTLDQATALARSGRYRDAIATANRIGSGRALHGEAQGQVANWRAEIRGRELLDRAYREAQSGSPAALAAAIRTTGQIPSGASASSEGARAASRWSDRLLRLAQSASSRDLLEAIRIAQSIPSNSRLYGTAQARIREWQAALRPPAPEPPRPAPSASESATGSSRGSEPAATDSAPERAKEPTAPEAAAPETDLGSEPRNDSGDSAPAISPDLRDELEDAATEAVAPAPDPAPSAPATEEPVESLPEAVFTDTND